MMKIRVNAGDGVTDAPLTDSSTGSATGARDLNGLPAAIRLDSNPAGADTKGTFIVNADQAGMHVINIEVGTAAFDEMIGEFQAEANLTKQDGSKLITD